MEIDPINPFIIAGLLVSRLPGRVFKQRIWGLCKKGAQNQAKIDEKGVMTTVRNDVMDMGRLKSTAESMDRIASLKPLWCFRTLGTSTAHLRLLTEEIGV